MWCKRLEKETFSSREVVDFSKNFIVTKVNADKDTTLARGFRVAGYPTTIVLRPSGDEADRVVGYAKPHEFVSKVNDYLAGKGTLSAMLAEEPSRASDYKFLDEVGEKLRDHGMFAEANQRFEIIVNGDKTNQSGIADDALFAMGRIALKQKRFADAVSNFSMLGEMFPESEISGDASFFVGYTYGKSGDKDKAVEKYREFLARFPKHEERDWVKKEIKKIEKEKAKK
ncbi:MAG: outer membrane protein assembly factor BamD [Candidatus Eisenbacteria bacterium]|nr:outer membrane protein assembly factor BamD [Candidatus Eisenbacteria bacterium]